MLLNLYIKAFFGGMGSTPTVSILIYSSEMTLYQRLFKLRYYLRVYYSLDNAFSFGYLHKIESSVNIGVKILDNNGVRLPY